MFRQTRFLFYIQGIKKFLLIFFSSCTLVGFGQLAPLKQGEKPPYSRKEEIIYRNNRYRLYNNYLSLGPGVLGSSARNGGQKSIGIDFQFHVKRQHFQVGGLMSGEDFGSNNQVGLHGGYGYRIESKSNNYAIFAGPSYYYGVLTLPYDSTIQANGIKIIEGVGGYLSVQAVLKLSYDIGFGVELYAETTKDYKQIGFRVIAFFSGAYRGKKNNFNPNVRSENPGGQ